MSTIFPNYNNNNNNNNGGGITNPSARFVDPSSMMQASNNAIGNSTMNSNLGPLMQMARLAEAASNHQNGSASMMNNNNNNNNDNAMASRLNLFQQLQALQQVPSAPQMPMNAALLAASNLTSSPQQQQLRPDVHNAGMMMQQQQGSDQLAQSVLAALTKFICQTVQSGNLPSNYNYNNVQHPSAAISTSTSSLDASEKQHSVASAAHSSKHSVASAEEEGGDQGGKVKAKSGEFIVPCRARGMPMEHNFQNAYFTLPKDIKHGDPLVCSFPACRNRGIKFLYCAYCKDPISRRNFRKHHSHLNEAKDDAAGARKRKSPSSSSTTNEQEKRDQEVVDMAMARNKKAKNSSSFEE